MDPTLAQLLLAMVGRSVRQGTLVEIVETVARLVRLIEPLLDKPPGPAPGG